MKTLSFAVSGARSALVKIALCLLPFTLISAPVSAASSLSMGNVSNPMIAGGTMTGASGFGLQGSTLGFNLTIADIGAPVQVYVAAFVPAGTYGLPADTWFCLTPTSGWQQMAGTYIPAGTGITAGTTVRVSLLTNVDINNISNLPKAEVYVGYGTSVAEMIQAARYKAVVALR